MKLLQKTTAGAFSTAGFLLLSACSNQVETTGNTIPTSKPSSSGKICCNTVGNRQVTTSGYNVLDNPRTRVNTGSQNNQVYNPVSRVNNNTQSAARNQAANTATHQASTTNTNSNVSYYDYGGSGSASASTVNYDYSSSSTSPNVTTAVHAGSTNGRPSVQVLASSSAATAQSMQQQMRNAGYAAVVVQDAGLYKVRIPYRSYEEAKSHLSQIRGRVPDAFVAR